MFKDADEADDRSIVQLLIDQIEFSNVIVLNKCDLVTEKVICEIKNTIKLLNLKAEVIETTRSLVNLSTVLNTGKFSFEEARENQKWLKEGRFDINTESEEYGVGSFLFNRQKPFHPQRLYDLLSKNFMLDIINPEAQHSHKHGDEEGEEEDEDDDEDLVPECRKGHEMELWEESTHTHQCNGPCKMKEFTLDPPFWRCHKCDFDLCLKCGEAQITVNDDDDDEEDETDKEY